MQGGNVNEFVDHTTYEECAVIYKGKKYFFHGIIYDDESNCYSYDIDIWDKNNCFVEQVFSEKKVLGRNVLMKLKQNQYLMENHFVKQKKKWNGLIGKHNSSK